MPARLPPLALPAPSSALSAPTSATRATACPALPSPLGHVSRSISLVAGLAVSFAMLSGSALAAGPAVSPPASAPAGSPAPGASAASGDPAENAPAVDEAVAPDARPTEAAEKDASVWDFIQPSEGASATPDVKAAAEELSSERLSELSDLGSPGGEPPTDYYIDPVAATNQDPLHLDAIDPKEFDIPVVVNDDVKRWMEYFLGRGRKYYTHYLERSTKWRPIEYKQIDARAMPRDLTYLSMIESGYSPGAVSYAAAAGLWQFMPATGRQYNLRVDWWVDERRDPVAETRAALDYLSYLHQMFAGDWWLSWASYNGGEGRVMNATRRYGTTDFWTIIAQNGLPSETENYVPKLIAAAIIGHHPERYGFVGIHYQPEFVFDTVEVPASVGVDVLAKCAGVSEEGFLDLNPALRRWALPPDPAVQTVRVPKGVAATFKTEFAKVPPEARLTYEQHTVKKGESMGSIAKKYGVAASDIARINHIQSTERIAVGMELIIPTLPHGGAEVPSPSAPTTTPTTGDGPVLRPDAVPSTSSSAATQGASKSSPAPAAPAPTTIVVTYKVRSGDTLANIARAQGVSMDDLKGWNGIRNENQIYAGQRLTIRKAAPPAAPSSTHPAAAPAKAPPKPAPAPTVYTVRSGDTLSGVAAARNVTLDQLKSWNKLSGNTIVVGQTLIVGGAAAVPAPSAASRTTVYVVRRGDTLGNIADRYNCTIADLKSWNGLSGATIYPGQKLQIKD